MYPQPVSQRSINHLVATLPGFENHFEQHPFTLINGAWARQALKHLISVGETDRLRLDARYVEDVVPASAYHLVFAFSTVEILHKPKPSLVKWLRLQASREVSHPTRFLVIEDLSSFTDDDFRILKKVFPKLVKLQFAGEPTTESYIRAQAISDLVGDNFNCVFAASSSRWIRDRPYES